MRTEPLLLGPFGGRRRGWEIFLQEHKADWLALLLGPAISVPFAACYAALVCQERTLQSKFPEVLQQIMWTQFAGAVLSMFIGQFVTTTNMDPLVAILFGQLAKRAEVRFRDEPEAFFPNMIMAMSLTTLMLGLTLYAVGRFRLAFMLRFFPYTVIGGFLAGSGLLILAESLKLAAGTDVLTLVLATLVRGAGAGAELAAAWAQLALACVYAFLAGHAREAHVFGTPALLVLCVGASVAAKVLTAGTWPPPSWFLAYPNPVEWWAPFSQLSEGILRFQPGRSIDVDLTLSFVTIMTVSWSINTLAIKKLVPLRRHVPRCDEQAEIQSLGVMNMSLGCLGCHASMQSFKIPMMMREVRAGDLWPIFNLVVSLLLFVYSPRVIVQTIPRFLFAGTVVRLASDLIIEWLIEARERIATKEWCILALTSLAIALDLSLGVVFGVFMTLLLFAVEYSSITGVVRTGSLQSAKSTVERSDHEHRFLAKHGGSVRILWLSGYLFFGSVTHALDEVRQTIADSDVVVVVLDFSLVPAMDASGVYAVIDLVEELKATGQRARLVLCGLVRRLENALRHAAEHKGVEAFMVHDLDSTLEWCEQHLLDHLAARGLRPRAPTRALVKIDSACCISGVEVDDAHESFSAIWKSLLAKELREFDPAALSIQALQEAAVVRSYGDGEVVFGRGEGATEILILVKGAVEVTQPQAPEGAVQWNLPRHHLNAAKGDMFVFEERRPRRVRRARRGAVFGAVEYLASCRASAEDDSPNCDPSSDGSWTQVPFQFTGVAVGSLEVFALPFGTLRQIEHKDGRLALLLRTWLSRLAAEALLARRVDPLIHGGAPPLPLDGLQRSLSPCGGAPPLLLDGLQRSLSP